jgi:hypothetical protein
MSLWIVLENNLYTQCFFKRKIYDYIYVCVCVCVCDLWFSVPESWKIVLEF